MQKKYLIINENNETFQMLLYEMPEKKEVANLTFKKRQENNKIVLKYKSNKLNSLNIYLPNFEKAIDIFINYLIENKIIVNIDEIVKVGYKIFNGINVLNDSEIITDKSIEILENKTNNINIIKYLNKIIPNATHVGISNDFHKISHRYINDKIKALTARKDTNFINCCIDNESSVCAIIDGKYNNIPLNLTPLECLTMRKKSENLSPQIIYFISEMKHISIGEAINLIDNHNINSISRKEDLEYLLNKVENGNKVAKIAFDRYIDYIIKNIIYYYNSFEGNINCIVLTGYIGENNNKIRKIILSKLEKELGIILDINENNKIGLNRIEEGVITTSKSKIPVFVIKSNEVELMLNDTYNITKTNRKVKKLTSNQ